MSGDFEQFHPDEICRLDVLDADFRRSELKGGLVSWWSENACFATKVCRQITCKFAMLTALFNVLFYR